jgi:parvulin-like peptidyl-prolyl isomerase
VATASGVKNKTVSQSHVLVATFVTFVLGVAGCAQDQPALARAAAQERETTPPGTPAQQISNSPTQPMPGGIAKRPVEESPKTDSSGPQRTAKGSILDQVIYQVQAPTDSSVAAKIRATVNGVAILDDEVRSGIYFLLIAIQRLPEPERSIKRKEVIDKQVQHLVEREVILQEATERFKDHPQVMEKLKEAANKEFEKKVRSVRESQHIKTDEEFKAQLTAQGLTLADLQRQIEREFMAVEYMRNLIMPALDRISREEIEDFYQKHPEEFQVKDGVTWQDIFVDAAKYRDRASARQFASTLAIRAKAGEDFKGLVKAFDQGDSSYRNGEGYGHLPGQIKPPEAEPVLFKMRPGEVGPIVETWNGFHVIRLIKREYKGIKPFDTETQRAIKRKLESEVWDREYQKIVRRMKSEASVQVSSH